MATNKFSVGDIYRSNTNPEKDFLITCVNISKDKEDSYRDYIVWEIVNPNKWDEFVCEKKGYNSIDALIADGKNTFPYVCAGECSPKSLNQRIKKYKMHLDKNIKLNTVKYDNDWEYWESVDSSKNKRDERGFYKID